MGGATCDVKENRQTPLTPLAKVAYRVFNNRVVETFIVAVIAVCVLSTAVIDGILGTRTKRKLIESLRSVSRDKLSGLRKAQIRYVFRCKFGLSRIRIRLAGGSYWLSIPCIIEGRKDGRDVKYMAKIVNGMSAIKHRYMTMLRNLGVAAGAMDMRFDEYEDAKEMASFERYCLTKLRDEQVSAPAVIGMFRLNEDDYMLVMEFIEGMPLSEVPVDNSMLDQVFQDIRTMHDHGFVHGDIKLDNFLVSGGKIFVLDCLKVGYSAFQAAKSFDTICALCAMCQKVPVDRVVGQARKYFSDDELLQAGKLLDVAVSKVDIELSDNKVRELRRALGNPV
ncbi:MAG: lipopolysaccharide core heptose(II) kinase RfaY [Methanocella sp.]